MIHPGKPFHNVCVVCGIGRRRIGAARRWTRPWICVRKESIGQCTFGGACDEQHAGPSDAKSEWFFRSRSTFSWRFGVVEFTKSGVGDIAQLLAVESVVSRFEWRSELSGGAIERQALRRQLAGKPPHRSLTRRNQKLPRPKTKQLETLQCGKAQDIFMRKIIPVGFIPLGRVWTFPTQSRRTIMQGRILASSRDIASLTPIAAVKNAKKNSAGPHRSKNTGSTICMFTSAPILANVPIAEKSSEKQKGFIKNTGPKLKRPYSERLPSNPNGK